MNSCILDLRLVSDVNGKTTTLFDSVKERFVIPLYQRAFSWGTEHYSNRENEIIQLIDDLMDSKTDYYLGSLIVYKRPGQDALCEVIDGQQRLTALYLLFRCLGLPIEKKGALSYDCRSKADNALNRIDDLISNPNNLETPYDEGIYHGIKTILQKIQQAENKDDYKACLINALKKAHLFQIEVPSCTDLNRYFEIMNTRGEQLEQHDIIKASLMAALDSSSERYLFAEVWNACRDMNDYVQMHFDPQRRDELFGEDWNSNKLTDMESGFQDINSMETVPVSFKSIITSDDFENKEIENDDNHSRFESIIDYNHFLLHVLKIFIDSENLKQADSEDNLSDDTLDDKKLIYFFKQVREKGRVDGKKMDDKLFAQRFLVCLLRCRFLFDQYIIKREYGTEKAEGKWSLQKLKNYKDKKNSKKAYPINTFDINNDVNKMIQACLRVSYTSPKSMHWITKLLKWAYVNDCGCGISPIQYEMVAQNVALDVVRPFVDGNNYQQGVGTHHVIFNFLDFLLWKANQKIEFNFEFRNSVEHWYPQNPNDQEGCRRWDDKNENGKMVDRFGNLALLPSSINSRFSNLPPKAKIGYESLINKGSLKLREMAAITKQSQSNESWIKAECDCHEKAMINLLREACIPASNEQIVCSREE